jgi:hypothetical protein
VAIEIGGAASCDEERRGVEVVQRTDRGGKAFAFPASAEEKEAQNLWVDLEFFPGCLAFW